MHLSEVIIHVCEVTESFIMCHHHDIMIHGCDITVDIMMYTTNRSKNKLVFTQYALEVDHCNIIIQDFDSTMDIKMHSAMRLLLVIVTSQCIFSYNLL